MHPTEGPLLAGSRRSNPTVAAGTTGLHLSLFRDLQSIVHLNPEIPDGAFELCVPEQELNGPEILGASVDQCGFRASQ